MQAKSKHAALVMVDTIQDDMATEQNIRGEGMFCVSKSRSSTDCFLMLVGTSKKKGATLGNPQAKDADNLLIDVDVQPLDDNPSSREDKRQDVDHFFRTAITKDVNSKSKKYRACKLCP